ncbi:MAG TPA: trigger factor [Fimbriimonas sp.]|nr:trigger factor [Fimbriimonas sp.]
MVITREELNPCTVKLNIVSDADEVKSGFESAFRQLTKKIKLPGFRPGKVPRSMLEPFVSAEEWNEAAADEIVQKLYPKAIEEQKLEVDRTTLPHVTVVAISKDESKFEFSAKVALPPKVELGEYKGLPVEQPAIDVTDEEVQYEIDELRRKGQTRVSITDRGVEEGEVAVLQIKPLDPPADARTFMTIAGQTFPQLDEAIMGMRVEEMKNLDLSFPENFQDKEWAGKSFSAQVTLGSLTSVRLPELDDAFAQSLKTESVDDLKNRIREAIGTAKQQMVRQMVHEQLVDRLMERSQVAVSDNMWENLANRRLSELAREQAEKQKTLENYAQENGMTAEEFAKAWQEKAKLEVERALLIQAVYSKEGMEIDTSELNRELLLMAQEFDTEPLTLLEELKQNGALDELHFRSLTRKVGDFLLSNAEVSIVDLDAQPKKAEEAAAPEAAPKKKRAPKKAAEEKPEE